MSKLKRQANVFSLLTDPLPWGKELLYELVKLIALKFLYKKPSYIRHKKYRGHFAVTRSLIEGLQKINIPFNYNTKYTYSLSEVVVVLSGVRTLRQAIRLKQKGIIRKIYAGPNIVVFSSDQNSVLAETEVDFVITPSKWVADIYIEDNPKLAGRILIWPAGVDTNYWRPCPSTRKDKILIFDKRTIDDEPNRIEQYSVYLNSLGYEVLVLVRCGDRGYTQEEYRRLLNESCLMVGLTVGSESQGIAWAEAWSCDVTTLILKKDTNTYQGREYKSSTAPYLSEKNGLFFNNFTDFKEKLEYWQSNKRKFSPRSWVLQKMSDEVCAKDLYSQINNIELSSLKKSI